MKFLVLTLLSFSSLAYAQDTQPLPQMMLGRGLIAKMKFSKTLIDINRMAEKPIFSEDRIAAEKAKEKAMEPNYFLGFECVGRDSRGNLNCYRVQPIAIDLAAGKIVERGHVLLVGEFDSQNTHPQPTEKEIRRFMNDMRATFSSYKDAHLSSWGQFKDNIIAWLGAGVFVVTAVASAGTTLIVPVLIATGVGAGGVGITNLQDAHQHSEQTNKDGWNWSSKPKSVSESTAKLFDGFIMNYQTRLLLDSSEIDYLFKINPDQFEHDPKYKKYNGNFDQFVKDEINRLEQEKTQRAATQPYPVYPN